MSFETEIARLVASNGRLEKIANDTGGYTTILGLLRETWPDLAARFEEEFGELLADIQSGAFTLSGTYDTIALGRAASADGEYFNVRPGGSDGLANFSLYKRIDAGTSTLITSYYSAAAVDALIATLTTAVSSIQTVVKQTDTGTFEVWLIDPAMPTRAVKVAYVDPDTGFFVVPRLEFMAAAQRSTRWLGGVEAGGLLPLAWDYRGRVRALLDEVSLQYVADNAGVGAMPDDDLPDIGDLKVTTGIRAETFNRLFSDVYFAGAIYAQNVATGEIFFRGALRTASIGQSGQSNATGSTNPNDDSAALTQNAYPEHVQTLNYSYKWHGPSANVFSPSSVTGFTGDPEFKAGDLEDTGAVGGANWYLQQRARRGLGSWSVIFDNHGVAGQTMAVIKPGGSGVAWQNGVDQLTKVVSLAGELGRSTIWRPFYSFVHGEGDAAAINNATLATAGATYEAELNSYEDSLQSVHKPLTAQPEDIKFILVGLGGRTDNITTGSPAFPRSLQFGEIAQAMLRAAVSNVNIFLACAGYLLLRNTNLHILNRGKRHMQEYVYKAWDVYEATGAKPMPLRAASAVYSASGGHHIDVTFTGYQMGSLRVFDTSNGGYLNAHPTHGLSVETGGTLSPYVAGTPVSITGITFTAANKLRIDLAASAAGGALNIAYNNGGGNAAAGYAYNYATIFDEDLTPSREYPERGLSNHLHPQVISVT